MKTFGSCFQLLPKKYNVKKSLKSTCTTSTFMLAIYRTLTIKSHTTIKRYLLGLLVKSIMGKPVFHNHYLAITYFIMQFPLLQLDILKTRVGHSASKVITKHHFYNI